MTGEKIVSYGLSSSSLPYYLAAFMATERREVTIISPFISQFYIPPLDPRFQLYGDSETSFFGAISFLPTIGVRINIFTTEGYVARITEKLRPLPEKVYIKIVPELHEKFFITSDFFYKGSANLTYNGLYENIENCEIGLVEMNERYVRGILQQIESTSKKLPRGMGSTRQP